MKNSSGTRFGLLLLVLLLPLSQQSLADNGWYVGGALGKAYVDENIDGTQFRANGTSFRISGGYEFNDYIGVEVSYLDLGTFEDSFDINGQTIPVSANADGFSFAAVGTVPLGERFFAKGRVGFYFADGQSTVNGITENDPSDQNPFVGLGLAFELTETLQLSMDVDYFDMDTVQPLLATLGFSIRF
jgi:OOP family OmpA-OmpF porin